MCDGTSKGRDFVIEDPTVVEAPLNLTADLFLVEAPLEPENLLRVSFVSELNLVLEKANWLSLVRTLITNFQIMPLDPMLLARISCAASILFPKRRSRSR